MTNPVESVDKLKLKEFWVDRVELLEELLSQAKSDSRKRFLIHEIWCAYEELNSMKMEQ